MMSPPPKARFIKPPNKLKMKVGAGGVDDALLEKAQHFVLRMEIDFKPIAKQLMGEMLKTLQSVRNDKGTPEELRKKEDMLANVIMQLKANGGMFGYQLISEIAALALYFLENAGDLNDDAINVLDIHAQTMQVIVTNNLRGDGGKEGYALVKELENACMRYAKKYKTVF